VSSYDFCGFVHAYETFCLGEPRKNEKEKSACVPITGENYVVLIS